MLISRRSRMAFRPMLDTLPSRLSPSTYPAIGPMPSDPMGTDTPTWETPVQVLTQPGSADPAPVAACPAGSVAASSPSSLSATVS